MKREEYRRETAGTQLNSNDEWNDYAQLRLNSFCWDLQNRVRDYLRDPEHRREFEEWYLQQYGKPYQWKTGKQKGECNDAL